MILFIKHINIEGPGSFQNLLNQAGCEIRIVELAQGQSLPPIEECRAVVSLGGPMSVYETNKYPFLVDEESFLLQAIHKKIPVLGICLGAQMLAKICLGKVIKSPVKEIGWYKVALNAEGRKDPLFSGLKNSLKVFQWHEDTFTIPQGAKLIVEGKGCKNQAFRIGSSVWGLQFHPEITSQLIKTWTDYYHQPPDVQKLLQGYSKYQDIYMEQARVICSNFSSIIAKKKEQSAV